MAQPDPRARGSGRAGELLAPPAAGAQQPLLGGGASAAANLRGSVGGGRSGPSGPSGKPAPQRGWAPPPERMSSVGELTAARVVSGGDLLSALGRRAPPLHARLSRVVSLCMLAHTLSLIPRSLPLVAARQSYRRSDMRGQSASSRSSRMRDAGDGAAMIKVRARACASEGKKGGSGGGRKVAAWRASHRPAFIIVRSPPSPSWQTNKGHRHRRRQPHAQAARVHRAVRGAAAGQPAARGRRRRGGRRRRCKRRRRRRRRQPRGAGAAEFKWLQPRLV